MLLLNDAISIIHDAESSMSQEKLIVSNKHVMIWEDTVTEYFEAQRRVQSFEHSTQNVIRMNKSSTVRWTRHVACIG
jgi:hypothetical protein